MYLNMEEASIESSTVTSSQSKTRPSKDENRLPKGVRKRIIGDNQTSFILISLSQRAYSRNVSLLISILAVLFVSEHCLHSTLRLLISFILVC